MSGVRLQVMGSLRVWRGDVELTPGPRQQRCLLAVLAARVDRPVGIADLIDLIWGADPPGSAVNVIHKYVGTLRRLLEPGLALRSDGSFITRRDNGYRFVAGAELDLVAFRRGVALAQGCADPDRALDLYVEALSRCEGPAGGELADSAGTTGVFAGIDGEFLDAAIAAGAVAVTRDRPAAVLPALRLAARIGRLHEPVHAALMTTLAAGGYQAEALETYRDIRERLVDELGIDPGRELQEAHRQVLDQAPVAVVVPTLRPAQLPPDQPMFVGRAVELGVLHDLVASMRDTGRTSPMVVAVDGMGGVGKSTLVTHFAHRVAGEFGDGQLFLDLRGHDEEDGSLPAAEALRSLLYGLGLRASDVPDTFDALVGTYRSLTAGRRILVLLDDVRDASQVRPLLPNSADSLVLITSRRPLVGLAASDGARLYRAYVPDLDDARQILAGRLAYLRNPRAIGVEPDVIDEIIEGCGRLPLALAILAARLSVRPKLSLTTVAAELRDGEQRLAAFPGGRGVTDPRTAFSWSYRQLSPGAARMFRLLSVALPPGITIEAAASLAGQDADRARAEIEELTEAALVAEQESGCFTSHVLVRAYAEELLDSAAERQAAVTRLLEYYLHSSYHAQVRLEPNRTPIVPEPPSPGVVPHRPASYREAIDWFSEHGEVLKEAVRVAADRGNGTLAWQLAITMQQYFEWFGHFQDWEDVMRFALRAAPDAIGEAHVLRSLAGARWFLNAHDESVTLLSAALRVFVERDMPLERVLTHINFHAVRTALGEHEQALAHAETAVELSRAAGNAQSEARGLDCVGRSLTRLGEHEQAAARLREALELNLASGRRHEEAMIRVSIAHNLIERDRTEEAVAELTLAVEAARAVGQGPYHFEAFRSLTELLIETRDTAGAREAFDRASGVLRSFQGGGPHHMRAQLSRLAARLPRGNGR